ncbi:MAG: hypothetical protein JW965_00585 [Bacteroidales bacterium]|nr:hypothetical protein [Bacteroidales bacterium]
MTIKIQNSVYHYRSPVKDPNKVSLYKTLWDEDCEDFYYYIEWLGLPKENNIIVLPRTNHYYYQAKDLEDTDALVSLKCLNHIRNLRSYLRNIYRNMQPNCYFTGCFSEGFMNNNNIKSYTNYICGKGFSNIHDNTGFSRSSIFKKKINRLLDGRNRFKLTRTSVSSILNDIGFIVLGMSELNGKTYFCAQKRLTS